MIITTVISLLVTATPFGGLVPGPPSMKEATEQTTRDFLDAAESLAEVNLVRMSGHLQYGRCENLVEFRARAWGWLTHAGGAPLTSSNVGEIRDVLVAHGWDAHRAEGWHDGVLTLGDAWAVGVVSDGSAIDVVVVDGETSVELRVFGPCLPVSEFERREYADLGSWEIDRPG